MQPGSGSGPDLLRARTWRNPVTDLRAFVTVPFVIVGGVAMRLYAPERMTDDLGILIHASQEGQLSRELEQAGAIKQGNLSRGGSHWRLPGEENLDVLVSEETWAVEALVNPVSGPDGLPVVAMSYLVLMKMQASRGIDIGDLSRMLGAADEENLGETRRVIRRTLPDAVEDLESLIQLGQ